MKLDITPEVAKVVTRAHTSGAEVSVRELARVLGFGDSGRLVAANAVREFVTNFHLELVPGFSELEFESLRVLRSAEKSGSPAGRVLSISALGEGPTTEFKSSMLTSMRDWSTNGSLVEHPSLPGELLKTICAFLNTGGGSLLVGIDDDGTASGGIDLDLKLKKWNADTWQLHFQSLVKERFYVGAEVQPYLRTEMASIDGRLVFLVEVQPRSARSFVRRDKGKPFEFFVRNGPRSDSLDMPTFYTSLARK